MERPIRRPSARALSFAALTLALGALLGPLLSPPAARAQIGTRDEVRIEVPDRPFLLVDAPRRALPRESAELRIQLRDGGQVSVALFRVRRPAELLGGTPQSLGVERQGISLAPGPIGREAEQLLSAGGRLPRSGASLTLVQQRPALRMPHPEGAREIVREAVVYDSFEDVEENVATYWVRTGDWSVRRLGLGRLPAGLYLAQVRAGPWVGNALVSVGDLVLLGRRGDVHDEALVTDPDGVPQPGVEVQVLHEGIQVRTATTDAEGRVRLPASDAAELRFLASRGEDHAWADLRHARLSPCDPRIYLGTGRPVYRFGERVYVRGQARGCDAEGRPIALAGEEIGLGPGPEERATTVRTDEDGNFVATLEAAGAIHAFFRGHTFERALRMDSRELPQRDLLVRVARPWAVVGQVVRVEVSDPEGGWPRAADVILETPTGRLMARVGPGAPAVFDVRVPPVEGTQRLELRASLGERGRVTFAAGELWVSQSRTLLSLSSTQLRGRAGEAFPIVLRAADPSGRPSAGEVALELYASDENAPIGEALWRGRVEVDAEGRAQAALPLSGDGPWIAVARRDGARARMAIWSRPRPPSLSSRGPLALLPVREAVAAGEPIAVDVRLPPGRGRAWLTLEQGGVLRSRIVEGRQLTQRVEIAAPANAGGIAHLVLSHVEGGRVQTATAAVEVAAAVAFGLQVRSDRRYYGAGEHATVTIEAATAAGAPHDAVISLWLADAGYWSLGGEDEYPLPHTFFRRPGRMASGGDSTEPLAYGAEEGRVLDSSLEWDGVRLPRSTFRHAWGYGGEVIRVERRGSLEAVLAAFARAAGFSGATVDCPEAAGEHRLSVRDLPWDLVVERLADELGAHVEVDAGRLSFDCLSGYGGGAGGLSGHGARVPQIRTGNADIRFIEEERREGTLFFVGLRRLGPDGRIELDVPLPDHPGRWRIESLAIADDGGGARAHSVVHTRAPLEIWMDLPSTFRVGDEVEGSIHVRGLAPAAAAGRAGRPRSVEVELSLPEEVRALAPLPRTIALDAEGLGEQPIRLRAGAPCEDHVVVRARMGAAEEAVRRRITVAREGVLEPLSLRAVVGPEAREVELALPTLTEPATLQIEADASLHGPAIAALERLREPRWNMPAMRIDRLASFAALARAVRLVEGSPGSLLGEEIHHAAASEAAALLSLSTQAGGFAWWRALPRSTYLTAAALHALAAFPGQASAEGSREAWEALRRDTEPEPRATLDPLTSALAASVLAPRGETERVEALLERALGAAGRSPEVYALAFEAADRGRIRPQRSRALAMLRAALERRLGTPRPAAACAGPVWFLCYRRWGERGEMARAAEILLRVGGASERALSARVASWIAGGPPYEAGFDWGSEEADVLALGALLRSGPGAVGPSAASERGGAAETFSVLLDGRPIRAAGGRVTVPAGAHRLRVVFGAREGRLSHLRVHGEVLAAAPAGATGNLRFERRIAFDGGLWTLELGLELPEAATDVELWVPLPAGLSLASLPEVEGGRVFVDRDGLHLLFERLERGERSLRFPLSRIAAGTFTAGPARLRAPSLERWAATSPLRVELR